METKQTRESLLQCLSWCGLSQLPEPYEGEGVWLKAIVRVVKADGGEYYAVMSKTNNAENRIVKVFGPVAAIVKTVAVYPYEWLHKAYLPVFKGNSKKDRIEYLAKFSPDVDFSEHTLKELDLEILRIAISKQRRENERYVKH